MTSLNLFTPDPSRIPYLDPSTGMLGGGQTGNLQAPKGGGNPITGFFDNLWNDIETTITGFPQGLKMIAGSVGNDLDRLLTGSSAAGEFQLDDIGDAIWEDYKHVYGPLFSGDVGTTAHRIHENPLGPILDIAGIATLGLGTAGALGARAAIAGVKGGAMSAKSVDRLAGLGGLRRVTDEGGISNFRHKMRDEDGNVVRTDDGEPLMVLDDVIEEAIAIGGEFVEDASGRGHLLMPETRELVSQARAPRGMSEGGNPFLQGTEFARELKPLSRNPMHRNRQKFGIFLANKFPEYALIGSNRKIARIERRRERGQAKAEQVRVLGPLTRLFENRTGRRFKNDPRVNTAAELLANRVRPVDRLNQLDTDLATLKGDAANPGALDDLRSTVEEVIDQAEAGSISDADLKTVTESLHERIGTFGRTLGDDDHGFDSMLARLDEREKAANNIGVIEPQMMTTRQRMRDLIANPLKPDEAEHVLKLSQAYGHVGAATTDALKEAGVNIGKDRHLMPQRVIGRDGDALDQDAVTTPTVLDRNLPNDLLNPTKVLTQGTRPANSKFATGYTYRYGLSMLDPDQVLKTYRTAARFKLQKQRFQKNINRMKIVRAGDQIPKGWGVVNLATNKRFARMHENMKQVINEEMPIIFGDNPMLGEMQQLFMDEFNKKIDQVADLNGQAGTAEKLADQRKGFELIAPNAAIKEMFNETRRSTEAWKRWLQEISSLWRFSVLNLRPQWLENSIVGSYMLLAASTGPMKMMRGLAMANPWGGMSGKGRDFARLTDEVAGNIRLQGAGRIETEASLQFLDHSIAGRTLGLTRQPNGKMGSITKKSVMGPLRAIRWYGQKMGKINAVTADDYPRRARFYELMRPKARKLMKATPGLGFDDAVRRLMTRTEVNKVNSKVKLADFDDPRTMVRGLNVTTQKNTRGNGLFSEHDAQILINGGEEAQKWFEKNVDAYNAGRHWTEPDNEQLSRDFATDSNDKARGYTSVSEQFDSQMQADIVKEFGSNMDEGDIVTIPGGGVHIGIVLRGGTDRRHIVQPGTDEWKQYAGDYAIFDPRTSGEREVTVRNGAPTAVSEAVVIVNRPILRKVNGRFFISREATDYVTSDVDALQRAINTELVPNERVVDQMTTQVLDDLVDFDDLTDFERNTLRYMVPFWSWVKGSTKFAARFPAERPIYADLGRIIGEQGAEDLAEELGFEPESFIRNLMTLGDAEGGRQTVVSTAGINPFVTPLDLGNAIRGLTSTAPARATTNPLNMINPFIKAPAEAAFNRSAFTGGPITGPIAGRDPEQTRFPTRLLEQLTRSFPQTRMLTETVGRDSARDRSRMFVPGFAPEAARLAGSPIRELNLQQARMKARQFARESQ